VRFIESEGHRAELELHDTDGGATIRLRVRGQTLAVMTSGTDPTYFSIALPYVLPEWARDQLQAAPILLELQSTFKAVKFFYTNEGATLISAVEQFCGSADEFAAHFWRLVGIVRDAGSSAIERILDRSETRAAADRFISTFMRGQDR